MPVLITAGLSPEAYRLRRILNMTDVVFSDQTALPHIPGSLNIVLPAAGSISFVHETLTACLDHSITHVYPLKLNEVMELSTARALFDEYGVKLIIPSDKWLGRQEMSGTSAVGEIAVLVDGDLQAGGLIQGDSSLDGETGVFTWKDYGSRKEYGLYLVEDAAL